MADFWKNWEEVITELRESGNAELAEELQLTRNYLNGLTDGWHEFLEAAELRLVKSSNFLTTEQDHKIRATLNEVKTALSNR